ncbi:unnamed protein product [Arabidopsis halleri]
MVRRCMQILITGYLKGTLKFKNMITEAAQKWTVEFLWFQVQMDPCHRQKNISYLHARLVFHHLCVS